jgi:hypothetical protein
LVKRIFLGALVCSAARRIALAFSGDVDPALVVFLTKCLGVPDGFGRAIGGGVASAVEGEAFFVGAELAGNDRVTGLVIGELTVLQCAVEAADQVRFANGLAQERGCACSHGAISYALVRVTRDEDHWNAVALGVEKHLKLDATKTRQLHVRDHARCLMKLL